MNKVSKNIAQVIKSNDINKLNKTGYDFVMNMSGFIAHYDINGFKYEYSSVSKLIHDIATSMDVSDKERYIRDPFFNNPEKTIGRGKNIQTYQEYYRNKYEVLAELEELTR
jgi:hypothetical protein